MVLGTNIIQKESHGLSTDQEIFIEDFNYNTIGNAKTFVKKFDDNMFQIKYASGLLEDQLVTTFKYTWNILCIFSVIYLFCVKCNLVKILHNYILFFDLCILRLI